MGALSAFVRSENFPGKRQYILHVQGVEQLSRWMQMKGKEEEQQFGKSASMVRKIRLKLR